MSDEKKVDTVFDPQSVVVTASPRRVTMNVVQESEDYYILESDDHRLQACKPKDECKVEKVSFIIGNSQIL